MGNCNELNKDVVKSALINAEAGYFTDELYQKVQYYDIADLLRAIISSSNNIPTDFTMEQMFSAQNDYFLMFYNKYKNFYSEEEITKP